MDADLKEAMRAKDATKLGVLRMLKSALKYAAIAKSGAEAELRGALAPSSSLLPPQPHNDRIARKAKHRNRVMVAVRR